MSNPCYLEHCDKWHLIAALASAEHVDTCSVTIKDNTSHTSKIFSRWLSPGIVDLRYEAPDDMNDILQAITYLEGKRLGTIGTTSSRLRDAIVSAGKYALTSTVSVDGVTAYVMNRNLSYIAPAMPTPME